jgi:hypothetical protein
MKAAEKRIEFVQQQKQQQKKVPEKKENFTNR